ncbi:MAG: DNA-binding transcriptional MerR regulator, partial [Oceanicoccus sp.]
MAEKHYTLEQICRLLNMSPRTIRYYIHEGLLDHPEGQKRGAYYLDSHLSQLQKIKEWQSAGYSLDRIRELLEEGETPTSTLLPLKPKRGDVQVVSRIFIAPGIELSINADQARLGPKQTRALYRQ